MFQQTVNIATGDGAMKTYITHPENSGPFAPIILYMDIWGIREELRVIARRITKIGYACILPDLYYRQGDDVGTAYYDENGRMISLHKLDDLRTERVQAARGQLTGNMVMRDTEAIMHFIDTQNWMRGGIIGSIGWCMGGWMVLSAAGNYPDRFQASVCLHGTKLISDQPDSPHHLVKKFHGGLYCGYGELDHLTPPTMAEEMAQLTKHSPVDYRATIHAGAEHGYALPDRDIFDARAAAHDWELIFDMWERRLGTSY